MHILNLTLFFAFVGAADANFQGCTPCRTVDARQCAGQGSEQRLEECVSDGTPYGGCWKKLQQCSCRFTAPIRFETIKTKTFAGSKAGGAHCT
ncbi:hypothetical protein JI435_428580 [Parastagonospora nodorum SN15]|uniref:Extracellular membrane protein CFEM domain-containing protein n=1 Tax=Phaeosphaeria nodorum (strain SN15 / ATCC MYA-4574 / FGSC 10173) TaxID=321614 RepID=A0A7U2ETL3_PHANO|nr:hypothetical protein JI435_428580 [Parastagonospora nodorum SN15]